jgi:hypothetical protein
MRAPRQLMFWLAVGGMAIVADVVVNIAAERLGTQIPGLKTRNDFRTGRNA